MIIIADSGSTKTDWCVLKNNCTLLSFRSIGFNPFFVDSVIVADEIKKSVPPGFNQDEVKQVFFYGAGCSSDDRNSIISAGILKIFRHACVEVSHDLLGAARALFGREEGIAAILGTGSNTCHYNGKIIVSNLTSLGFILGDEGSGAYLGKKFLAAVILNDLPEPVITAFQQRYKLSKDDILTSVYSKPFPNRFLASFCPFLAENIHETSVHRLLSEAFLDFFDRQICRYDNYHKYQVRCVGSVAWNFKDLLMEAAAKRNIRITKTLESPMNDLTAYHLGIIQGSQA